MAIFVNVRIFPQGNSLARRVFPRRYLYLQIIEDRINKAQFKKRARYTRHKEGKGVTRDEET